MDLTVKLCKRCTGIFATESDRCTECRRYEFRRDLLTVYADGEYTEEYKDYVRNYVHSSQLRQEVDRAVERKVQEATESARTEARHVTMMNSLQGIDESNKEIVRALDTVNTNLQSVTTNLQSVTELLKRSMESRDEGMDAEWSIVKDH